MYVLIGVQPIKIRHLIKKSWDNFFHSTLTYSIFFFYIKCFILIGWTPIKTSIFERQISFPQTHLKVELIYHTQIHQATIAMAESRKIHGKSISRGAPKISHLFFVYDSLIFGHAIVLECQHLKNLFAPTRKHRANWSTMTSRQSLLVQMSSRRLETK